MKDFLVGGKAYGDVATRLAANNMNPNALRTNSTLRKDEWKRMDDAIVGVQRHRLNVIGDLVGYGLTYDLGNALGTTVLETETMSDMNDAEVTIDGLAAMNNDAIKYEIGYLPLPIIHKRYFLPLRKLMSSRNGSTPLDTSMAEGASRKVAEKSDAMAINGAGTFAYGGGNLYGFTNFPSRQTLDLNVAWNVSGATGATMTDDVIRAKQKSLDKKCFGPWIVYAAQPYEGKLDEDHKAATNDTIRQRLLRINGIKEVKVLDKLASGILLVPLDSSQVRVVRGLPLTNVQWDSEGGWLFHFKVMTIEVLQLRADQDGNCGLVHMSEPS